MTLILVLLISFAQTKFAIATRTTTTEPTTPTPLPPCDPNNCTLVPGPDCHQFLQCSGEGDIIVKNCEDYGYFSPQTGMCLSWSALPASEQFRYICDDKFCPKVLPPGLCLKPRGICSSLFWKADRSNGHCGAELMSCPPHTLFNGYDGCSQCDYIFPYNNGMNCCDLKEK